MASVSERAEKVLVRKLVKRYGDTENEGANKRIQSEVQRALRAKEGKALTCFDLEKLERKVERIARASRKKRLAVKEGIHDIKLNGEVSRKLEDFQGQTKVPLNNYIVFSEAKKYQHEKETKVKMEREQIKKIEIQDALQHQINERKKRELEEKHVETQYAEEMYYQVEDWKREQKQKKLDMKMKNMKTKADQEQQLKEIEHKRRKQREIKERDEAEMIDRALEALRLEEKERKERQKKQKEYLMKVRIENEKQKEIKRQMMLFQQQEDKRLQKEYADRLDEQERLRVETFEKMKEKSSNNQKMYLKATEKRAQKEREDEMKAIAYQKEKIRKDNESELERIRAREEKKKDMNRFLAQQILEKREKEQEEAKSNEVFSIQYQREMAMALEKEEKEKRLRKLAAKQHRLDLQKQIESKRLQQSETDSTIMSKNEEMMNMRELISFSNDKSMLNAIEEKVMKAQAAEKMKESLRLGLNNREDKDMVIY